MPPTAVATTGSPAAMASRTAFGIPSESDADTSNSHRERICGTSLLRPRKMTFSVMPASRACRSSAPAARHRRSAGTWHSASGADLPRRVNQVLIAFYRAVHVADRRDQEITFAGRWERRRAGACRGKFSQVDSIVNYGDTRGGNVPDLHQVLRHGSRIRQHHGRQLLDGPQDDFTSPRLPPGLPRSRRLAITTGTPARRAATIPSRFAYRSWACSTS